MHARVTTITGATNIDGGVAHIRDEVIPELEHHNGFRGISVSRDEAIGVVGVLSLWETEADLQASESVVGKVHDRAVSVMGGEATVEMFEQAVAESVPGDSPPQFLRIQRISMDPGAVDGNIAFFTATVLPSMKGTAGFRGVRLMIDRASGHGFTGTLWADASAREAGAEEGERRRQDAAGRGVTFEDASDRTVLLNRLK